MGRLDRKKWQKERKWTTVREGERGHTPLFSGFLRRFEAQEPDEPFTDGIGFWSTGRCFQHIGVRKINGFSEFGAKFAVIVMDEETGGFAISRGFFDLHASQVQSTLSGAVAKCYQSARQGVKSFFRSIASKAQV